MANEPASRPDRREPVVYQIRVEGHLGQEWTRWFCDLTITLLKNGDTLLTGPVVDQAALYGLLRQVRDLGMPLVSVNRLLASCGESVEEKSIPVTWVPEEERENEFD